MLQPQQASQGSLAAGVLHVPLWPPVTEARCALAARNQKPARRLFLARLAATLGVRNLSAQLLLYQLLKGYFLSKINGYTQGSCIPGNHRATFIRN